MGKQKINWDEINRNTKMGDIRSRYFSCANGRLAIWTTDRLYEGGDYAAFLTERNGIVIERSFHNLRKEARAQALAWTNGPGRDYTINEEP